MKRLTKKRLSACGLVLSCIFLAGFIASAGREFGYTGRTITIGCALGCFCVGSTHVDSRRGFDYLNGFDPLVIPWPKRYRSIIGIPLWMPFLALGIPSFIVWRRVRKPRVGHCADCGYDLTGNTSGVCPECGSKVESP